MRLTKVLIWLAASAAAGLTAVPSLAGMDSPDRTGLESGGRTSASTARWSPRDLQEPGLPVGGGMKVYLITIGQGDQVFEKFGHNAIWLYDEAAGINAAYNYGTFDFAQPGYYRRLMKGDMQYWMEAYNGVSMINYYISVNRSVWAQELNLTESQKSELRSALENNALEENKYYTYDYYRDNCSTRVRDAIDRAAGGVVRAQLVGQPTNTTYRGHTSRLTADEWPAYTGLLLAMGPMVDRPIDAWEESFLPVQLMKRISLVRTTNADGDSVPLVMLERQLFGSTRPAEWDRPPRRIPVYTAAGVLFGGLLLLLGRESKRRRWAAVAFFALAIVWSLAAGIFGGMIAALWAVTDHVATYRNENVLQVNMLSFVLLVQLILLTRGRAARSAQLMAKTIVVLSAIGLVMSILPWFPQHNGPIVGLVLPIHAGLALALMQRDTQAVRGTGRP
jgi:Domain of unknown function (DUF4105)